MITTIVVNVDRELVKYCFVRWHKWISIFLIVIRYIKLGRESH
jgi:hypothetical protein